MPDSPVFAHSPINFNAARSRDSRWRGPARARATGSLEAADTALAPSTLHQTSLRPCSPASTRNSAYLSSTHRIHPLPTRLPTRLPTLRSRPDPLTPKARVIVVGRAGAGAARVLAPRRLAKCSPLRQRKPQSLLPLQRCEAGAQRHSLKTARSSARLSALSRFARVVALGRTWTILPPPVFWLRKMRCTLVTCWLRRSRPAWHRFHPWLPHLSSSSNSRFPTLICLPRKW